jgi:DNA-binding CsgD family transcriptional regulator/tetratricopeptide (TPR) repeat protein
VVAVRCPALIGRDDEAAALARAVRLAAQGTGRVVVVTGEAGVGKTRLATATRGSAQAAGIPVTVGRAAEEHASVPLRVWSDALVRPTRIVSPTDVPLLAPYMGALGLMVPHWRPVGWQATEEAPLVLGEAVLRTLSHLAGQTGLLVVLEDLHWADAQSLAVLSYVADHIEEVAVLIVVTARTEPAGESLVVELRRKGCDILELQRLTARQVAQMTAACGLDDVSVQRLALADGLPLLVEDLLGAEADARPRRFAELILGRLTGLDALSRRATETAALLGERCDWSVVMVALGVDREAGEISLRRIVEVDLITVHGAEVRFRHALTREVVSDQLLPTQREAFSAAAAFALLEVAPPTIERDVLAADLFVDAGDIDQAVETLEVSVRRSLDAGDLPAADLAAERAFTVADRARSERAVRLGVELAGIRLDAGRASEAIELGEGLLARADGVDRSLSLRLHVLLARANAAAGDWDCAERHLAGARSLSPGIAAQAELALVEGRCALGTARPGQRIVIEHLATKAVALAAQADRPQLECAALLFAGRVARLRDLHPAAVLLSRALDVAEASGLTLARLEVLNELGTVEMLRDAEVDRLERAYAEARRTGAFGAAASAGLNLASALVMTGRHRRGADQALEVETVAQRLGLVPLQAGCAFMRGVGDAFDGDRAAAEAHLGRALSLAPDDADLRSGVWAIGHGIGALVLEDRERAQRAFANARRSAPERLTSILDAALGPSLLLAATDGEIRPPQVREAIETQPRGALWSDLWLGAALSVALARVGENGAAERELDAALAAGRNYPLFGTLVRRLVAPTAIDTGFADPVVLLRDAEKGYEALSLARGASAVRGLLVSIGQSAPRRRTGDGVVGEGLLRRGVTAREAEVLRLLGDRLTNRQIAAQLFLSPKTVEKHVASLTAKLEVTDRIALGDIARGGR